MNLLINYANEKFRQSQMLNSQTGINPGGFDKVVSYSPENIDSDFFQQNRKILSASRGNGYWLWKPYFIRKALQALQDGDYLFYADSGAYFVASIKPLINICEQTGQDIIPFDTRRMEYQYTKKDAFLLLDCDTPEFTHSLHRLGAFALFKKTDFTVDFVEELLKRDQDERLITDHPNVLGFPNYDGFVDHRHDQSVFSLLTKKYGLESFRDPSQFGNSVMGMYPNSPYGQLIEHTRARHLLWRTRARSWIKNIITQVRPDGE